MNRTLAQALSVIFHPLLMPTYLFYVILYVLPQSVITFPVEQRWLIMAIVFFTTFIIPGVGTYYLYRNGYISSVEMENRPERNLPFFFTSLCYAVTCFLFFREAYIDRLLFYVMCLITLSVFLTYIFSFLWKISAHSVGIGGALGILLLLQGIFQTSNLIYVIIPLIMLTGLVMSARLALNAHTPAEVYSGFLLGASVSIGLLLAVT